MDAFRRANEAAEMAHLQHQQETKHRFQEVMETIKSRYQDIPEEMLAMYELIMEQTSSGGGYFSTPGAVNLDQQVHQYVKAQAYQMAGMYIDREADGSVAFYDFAAMLADSDSMMYYPQGFDDEDIDVAPGIEIWTRDQNERLYGKVAEALYRFLHYRGVFLIEKARRPCPACAASPPQDCNECGGLGWIIEDPEPAPRNPIAGGPDAPRTERPPADHLLDSNLQALATLEAIRKWCDLSDGTPAEQALMEIDRLVSALLPETSLSDPQFSGLAKCLCGFEGKIASPEFFEHIRSCAALVNPGKASEPGQEDPRSAE